MQSETLLELKNVSLFFPDVERPILQNINYQLYANDFVIVLGGNGSGKSSLIKIINQQYPLSSGEIIFQGKSRSKMDLNSQKQIVTLSQNMQEALFFELTVLENCILWDIHTKFIACKKPSLEEKNFYQQYLLEFNPNLADKMDLKIKNLSGGEKQALMLGLCLLRTPKILLLDEHTSALDPKTAAKIIDLTARLVKVHKLTCVITTHNLDHALKYGDKLIAIKDGQITYKVEGEEKHSLSREALMHYCY